MTQPSHLLSREGHIPLVPKSQQRTLFLLPFSLRLQSSEAGRLLAFPSVPTRLRKREHNIHTAQMVAASWLRPAGSRLLWAVPT